MNNYVFGLPRVSLRVNLEDTFVFFPKKKRKERERERERERKKKRKKEREKR
ncbi:hypothetical protein Syun_027519 [Stephania yunnanensis]|uniref:Uncharacterized protein n=1 Tax=Stephania yunnanensis TaxID=152371 RepID=A0AAP0HL44_9MAGN